MTFKEVVEFDKEVKIVADERGVDKPNDDKNDEEDEVDG